MTTHNFKPWLALLAAALLNFCAGAHADGLADLRAAMARLQGQTPVRAQLELKSWSRNGEGKEAEENQAQLSLQLEDGARGLQLSYGKELLQHVEQEQRNKSKDANSKTPTLHAMRELDATEARSLLNSAPSLARRLDEARFKGEKSDVYKGSPARLLSFEFGMDKLSERDRKYLKKLDATLDIWIAADGTPLASNFRSKASGRAMVVISFEQQEDEDHVYGLVNDRLVTLRKEVRSSGAGAGERGESKVVKTLQIVS